MNFYGRDFLKIMDYSEAELRHVLKYPPLAVSPQVSFYILLHSIPFVKHFFKIFYWTAKQ